MHASGRACFNARMRKENGYAGAQDWMRRMSHSDAQRASGLRDAAAATGSSALPRPSAFFGDSGWGAAEVREPARERESSLPPPAGPTLVGAAPVPAAVARPSAGLTAPQRTSPTKRVRVLAYINQLIATDVVGLCCVYVRMIHVRYGSMNRHYTWTAPAPPPTTPALQARAEHFLVQFQILFHICLYSCLIDAVPLSHPTFTNAWAPACWHPSGAPRRWAC